MPVLPLSLNYNAHTTSLIVSYRHLRPFVIVPPRWRPWANGLCGNLIDGIKEQTDTRQGAMSITVSRCNPLNRLC